MLRVEITYEDGGGSEGPLTDILTAWQGWSPADPSVDDLRNALAEAAVEIVADVQTATEHRIELDGGGAGGVNERAEYRIIYTDDFAEAA